MGYDHSECPVESSPDVEAVNSSEDAGSHVHEEKLLKLSLFAPDQLGGSDYPLEIDDFFLVELGRPFKALWFSYNFHAVSSDCAVEECAQVLAVGVVNAAFSPDVIHRLELFLLSFKSSLDAIPLISKGLY